MSAKRTFFAIAMASAAPLATVAQELPAPQELALRVEAALQPFWAIEDFRIVAEARQGDPITPEALFRFEAEASPRADLFMPGADPVGPFLPVIKTFDSDDARTLYGTIRLSYQAGNWSGKTDIENPVDGLGQPLDLFANPTLVMGSETERQQLEILNANTIEAAAAELARARENLQTRHAALVAAAQKENREAIARLQQEQASALAALDLEFTRLRDSRAPEIAAMRAELAAELAALRQENDSRIAAEKQRLANELAQLQRDNASEIAGIEADHAARVGALNARYAEALAELEAGLEARQARLAQEVADAETILEKQQRLIALMENAAGNDTRIAELRAARIAQNRQMFESFPAKFPGTLSCQLDEGGAVDSYSMDFIVAERSSTGLRGQLEGDRWQENATFLLVDTPPDQEQIIRFVANFNVGPDSYDLTMRNNGTLAGDATGRIRVAGIPGEGRCTMVFGIR